MVLLIPPGIWHRLCFTHLVRVRSTKGFQMTPSHHNSQVGILFILKSVYSNQNLGTEKVTINYYELTGPTVIQTLTNALFIT